MSTVIKALPADLEEWKEAVFEVYVLLREKKRVQGNGLFLLMLTIIFLMSEIWFNVYL
jgi:hypothetical protein